MPKFERYSAVGVFGVPIYNPETQLLMGGLEMINFMRRHDIDPEPLPEGLTDITPYYGTASNFKYFLSYEAGQSTATVDLLPRTPHSETQEPFEDVMAITEKRTITIPTDQEVFALVGPSPRYGATLCVHEVIAFSE